MPAPSPPLRHQPGRDELGVEVRLAGKRHDVVPGEHDAGAALQRSLGDDIDCGCLDLDHVCLGIDGSEIVAQAGPIRKVGGRGDDIRLEVVCGRLARP